MCDLQKKRPRRREATAALCGRVRDAVFACLRSPFCSGSSRRLKEKAVIMDTRHTAARDGSESLIERQEAGRCPLGL